MVAAVCELGVNVSNARERNAIREMAISAFHNYAEALRERGETVRDTDPSTWPNFLHVEFRQLTTLTKVMRVLGMPDGLFGGTEHDIEGLHARYCERCRN